MHLIRHSEDGTLITAMTVGGGSLLNGVPWRGWGGGNGDPLPSDVSCNSV